MALTRKFIVELTQHQLDTWTGKEPKPLPETSEKVLELWDQRKERLENLIAQSQTEEEIISKMIQQEEDQGLEAPILDTATATWRKSPEECPEKTEQARTLPASPIKTEYSPENKKLRLTFANHGLMNSTPFLEDPVYHEAARLLNVDSSDETWFEIMFSHIHPVTKRIMIERYNILSFCLTRALENPLNLTSTLGQESTYQLEFSVDEANVLFVDPEDM